MGLLFESSSDFTEHMSSEISAPVWHPVLLVADLFPISMVATVSKIKFAIKRHSAHSAVADECATFFFLVYSRLT
jgi:hypothetical protein